MTAYRDDAAVPGLLVCSGLDPSGGAGFIADVRVAALLGTRPVGVITAATIQDTSGVAGSEPLPAELVREQLERLLSDVEVAAVKIGMLGSIDVAVAIGEALALTGAPVVWDPILAPSRGEVPLVRGPFERALAALQPHLTLLTPNARELAILVGRPIGGGIDGLPEAIAAGVSLATELGAAVLVKGGHLADAGDEAAHSVDVLCRRDGTVTLRGPRTRHGEDVHGTGCALATAIAAHLARGAELVAACREAKAFVAERIARPMHPGRGAAAVV